MWEVNPDWQNYEWTSLNSNKVFEGNILITRCESHDQTFVKFIVAFCAKYLCFIPVKISRFIGIVLQLKTLDVSQVNYVGKLITKFVF